MICEEGTNSECLRSNELDMATEDYDLVNVACFVLAAIPAETDYSAPSARISTAMLTNPTKISAAMRIITIHSRYSPCA